MLLSPISAVQPAINAAAATIAAISEVITPERIPYVLFCLFIFSPSLINISVHVLYNNKINPLFLEDTAQFLKTARSVVFKAKSPGAVRLQFEYKQSWTTAAPARTAAYPLSVDSTLKVSLAAQ
jgi:hypothetical protein